MSSDRPETPPPEDHSESLEAPAESNKALPIVGAQSYVPSSFDLVFPTHRARDTAKMYIPPVFLQSEAVDSSLPLGSGASFSVTRQSLPPGPAELVETTDMGGWVVEKVTAAPVRPKYVVYKSARVAFKENGFPKTPQDRRALQSVLTEFHVLLHPPLLAHPNIIDFLGLAWGSNHADPYHRLPVLVVEYASRGTLADVQLRGPPLANRLKAELCLGVARGLEALHSCGIVHGDMKPENILVFSGEGQDLRPKLADFGFAVVEDTEPSEVLIGGTRTWCAPEAFSPVRADRIKLTDVYSLGLVAWSIALDGRDPFSLMLPGGLVASERVEKIKELKETDQVLGLSGVDKWMLKWMASRKSVMPELIDGLVGTARSGSKEGLGIMQSLNAQHLAGLQPEQQLQRMQGLLSAVLTTSIDQVYYKDLDVIFSHTLTREPDRRDLGAVIRQLDSKQATGLASGMASLAVGNSAAAAAPVIGLDAGEEGQAAPVASNQVPSHPKPEAQYLITNTSSERRHFKTTPVPAASIASPQPGVINSTPGSSKIDWSKLGFKHRRYSWQLTRDLDPSLQSFVVKSLLHFDDAPSRFPLAAFLLNGYGLPADPDHALKCMAEAARANHGIAQAYLPRLANACQKEIPSDIPVLEYLENQATRGSRMALEELQRLDPEKASQCRKRIRFGYGGVGANWFTDGQMLFGLTQSTLMSKDFSPESLGDLAELQSVEINRKGDSLMHAAASVGAYGLLRGLLASGHFDVNRPNRTGETALLCACRSGHADIVMLLLSSGARASMQSATGETPLHWLLSFDEGINIQLLGDDLVKRGGARVDAYTTCHTAHSVFPGSIDVDFQVEGTPLMWAVHDDQPRVVSYLLSRGADPNWRLRRDTSSPIEWAAFYHHTECLKLLIDHLERTATVPVTTTGDRDLRHAVLYHPLVNKAVHASDKFSMILRNGARYLDRLRSTLALLQEKTRLVRFTLGGHQETLLHFAAREAHDEACRVILELGWRADEIDEPAGPAGRTALLESVRWNRRPLFRLLAAHGADARVLSAGPCDEAGGGGGRTWTALHLFADQAHDDDLGLVDDLVAAGLEVDASGCGGGASGGAVRGETPFHVAVRRGAFRLADKLLSLGASIDAPHARSALLVSPRPLTGLGHAVALNARHGLGALRYLLSKGPAFVVEPARGLTALHLAALVPAGLSYVGGGAVGRDAFDWETNLIIAGELLQWFRAPGQLDQRCGWQQKTALHLAAERGNVGVVEKLVLAGASKELRSEGGKTASELARETWAGHRDPGVLSQILQWLD